VDHVTSPPARVDTVLTPYRRYTARVRYVNVVGVGPYSAPIQFTTLATGISDTSTRLKVPSVLFLHIPRLVVISVEVL